MTAAAPSLAAVVHGPEEVEAALLGGATLIATPDATQVAAIQNASGGRADVLFLGPVMSVVRASAADRIAIPVTGVDGPAPVGLSPGAKRLMAVIEAGNEGAEALVPRLAGTGFSDLLIDLGRGDGRLSKIGLPKLRRLGEAAREAGLGLAFTGALEAPDVPRLRVLRPDALVFDEALRRQGRLDRMAILEIAALLRAEVPSAEGQADRIFVRELVVEMEIGAYGHERGRRQRVRFDVEAEVPRASASAGMGAIYSYDLITDAVAMLTASAHVDFVETLAEDLSAMVLSDPRVRSVRIRVEKLDLGPAGVGIEIQRAR